MKYTKTEQNLVNVLQHKINSIKKQNKNLDTKIKKIQEKRLVLSVKETELRNKIININDRLQKRCKHKCSTHLRYNGRDDVNYTHRVICDDCGEQVGKYGEQTPYG